MCKHERLKHLGSPYKPYVWCRDCGALKVKGNGTHWVPPGRAWRTAESTPIPRKKNPQLPLGFDAEQQGE